MSSVLSEVECYQCGFPGAWREFYCRSAEWDVTCPRCGYSKRWKHISRFRCGHLEKGVIEVLYSAGAYFAKWADGGGGEQGSLSETDIEETAAQMRADIASGKLSKESYVTRFDFKTHEVTALVGQVPTHGPAEQECDLEEEICEVECEQEDDDLSYEV
jgi:endogenous inhibitor of DNA gyrase (YacG/DUF329 family)